jgi:hypothetical protein
VRDHVYVRPVVGVGVFGLFVWQDQEAGVTLFDPVTVPTLIPSVLYKLEQT